MDDGETTTARPAATRDHDPAATSGPVAAATATPGTGNTASGTTRAPDSAGGGMLA